MAEQALHGSPRQAKQAGNLVVAVALQLPASDGLQLGITQQSQEVPALVAHQRQQVWGRALKGHCCNAGTLVFSPDGRRLLAGTPPLPVMKRIWDMTGKEVFRLGGGTENLVWAAFADCGREVVDLNWADIKFRLFDARTGNQKRVFTDQKLLALCRAREAFPMPRVRLLQVGPGGRRVLCTPCGSVVAIWDLREGPGPAVVFEGHTGEMTFCRFSSDGQLVLTESEDRTVRLWDARTGKQKAPFKGHEGAVTWAALDSGHTRLVTASPDRPGSGLRSRWAPRRGARWGCDATVGPRRSVCRPRSFATSLHAGRARTLRGPR